MPDTLGLLEEALQIARDLGYHVREDPLGELPGGGCMIGGTKHVLLNLEHAPAERLDHLLAALVADPRLAAEPKSRLLEDRLRAVSDGHASR